MRARVIPAKQEKWMTWELNTYEDIMCSACLIHNREMFTGRKHHGGVIRIVSIPRSTSSGSLLLDQIPWSSGTKVDVPFQNLFKQFNSVFL